MHWKEIGIGLAVILITLGVYLIGCNRDAPSSGPAATAAGSREAAFGIRSFKKGTAGEWIWQVELDESIGRANQYQLILCSEPASDDAPRLAEEMQRQILFRSEQVKASSTANVHFRLEITPLDGQRAAMRHGIPAVRLDYRLVLLSGKGGFSFGESQVSGDIVVATDFQRRGDIRNGSLQLGQFVTQDLAGKYIHRLVLQEKKQRLAEMPGLPPPAI